MAKLSFSDRKDTIENELLLLCARSELDKKSIERLKVLAQSGHPDWEELLHSALRNRVMPVVYTNLKKYCAPDVPAKICAQFESLFLNNAAYNKLLAGHLLVILQLFRIYRITAVPFKGPVLAVSAYGDLSLRTFSDLDILISSKDVEAAVQLLIRHGYSTLSDLSLDQYLYFVALNHHAHLYNREFNVTVELHWEMTGRYFSYRLELEEVTGALAHATLLDHEVPDIRTEYVLVYLCIHGNRHLWLQLDFVSSIAGVIRKHPGIDWDLCVKVAEKIGARRMLLLGLILADKLLKARIPDRFRFDFKADRKLQGAAMQAEEFLYSSISTPDEIGYLKTLLFHHRTMDHFADGIGYGFRKIFTPDILDMQVISLPRFMWTFYKIVRPVRLSLRSLFARSITGKK